MLVLWPALLRTPLLSNPIQPDMMTRLPPSPFLPLCALLACWVLMTSPALAQPVYSERVMSLLRQMTLEEKAGQLNLQAGHDPGIDPLPRTPISSPLVEQAVREGKVGGVFNIAGADNTRQLQQVAVTQSRLKIPLLIGLDVVHGFRTIFPVPIGQAASFNLDLISRAERVAAVEASAAGVNWTFAPVLDMARDPRWGRMVETAGESPWYTAAIARARVLAFQGEHLSDPSSILACAKHFVGNGATEGGREYTGANLSFRSMRDNELPPFEAAVEAGIGCLMPAFNAVDGVPGIVNRRMLSDVLRNEWHFAGLVVTDHGAIAELPFHGVAATLADASRAALAAGVDMDMASMGFGATLPEAVRVGKLDEAMLDQAVLRVLAIKERLGLFDDPFARHDSANEHRLVGHPDHLALARQLAEESLVLLKNDKALLPFKASARSIALIGPFGADRNHLMGPWEAAGIHREVVSLRDGIKRVHPRITIRTVATGYENTPDPNALARAVAAAKASDLVVLAVGEQAMDSGEASSRANPGLPGQQLALVKAVARLGKPFVVVVMAGRPMIEPALYTLAPAVVQAWFPGSQGGEAIARMLFGLSEPVGHLPVSIVRSIGQIPLTHDKRSTGRPSPGPPEAWASGYIDEATSPLFPFGYGLAYTQFRYHAPVLLDSDGTDASTYRIKVTVKNTGKRAGTTLVQLYTHQHIAAIAQPEKQLRGFTRLALQPGQQADAIITLNRRDLAYWSADNNRQPPQGRIDLMTGPHAGDTQATLLFLPD